jgi:hypothetical protein
MVHKDEGIFKATDGDTITKSDVDVDDVKIFGWETMNWLALRGLRNSSICAKRKWKFSRVKQEAIF